MHYAYPGFSCYSQGARLLEEPDTRHENTLHELDIRRLLRLFEHNVPDTDDVRRQHPLHG